MRRWRLAAGYQSSVQMKNEEGQRSCNSAQQVPPNYGVREWSEPRDSTKHSEKIPQPRRQPAPDRVEMRPSDGASQTRGAYVSTVAVT